MDSSGQDSSAKSKRTADNRPTNGKGIGTNERKLPGRTASHTISPTRNLRSQQTQRQQRKSPEGQQDQRPGKKASASNEKTKNNKSRQWNIVETLGGRKRPADEKEIEASPKKVKVSATSATVKPLKDELGATKALPKLRQFRIPKKKMVSKKEESNGESNRNDDSKIIRASTSQYKKADAKVTVPSKQQTNNIRDLRTDPEGESKGRKRKSDSELPTNELEDVGPRKRAGTEKKRVDKPLPVSLLSTNDTNASKPQRQRPGSSGSMQRKKAVENYHETMVRQKIANAENSRGQYSLKICHSSQPSPANIISSMDESATLQDCYNDANSVLKTEGMDFDNPVPEILQMVTEANASNSQYGIDAMDEMEVDSLPLTSSKKHIVIILDTNVWIENIPLIRKILNMKEFQNSSSPDVVLRIVIPWMVLQEIDNSIHRNKASNKKREFQNAAKYIHELLSKRDGRVQGQRAAEAVIGIEFNELMADDSILNCVIQYDKYPQFITVFVTNDINLLNKALVHNLTAFKGEIPLLDTLHQIIFKSEGKTEISNFNLFASDSHFGTTERAEYSQHAVENPPTFCASEVIGMDIDDPMGEEDFGKVPSSETISISVPYSNSRPTFDTVIDEIRKSLTHIIVPKMAEEYGEDGWRFAIKIKPPFSVESGLRCIQLHWIAVFSFLFPSRCKEVLEELLDIFKNKPDLQKEDEVRLWRLNICRIALVFLSMNDNLVKKPRISETVKLLKDYIESS